jgi:hypothetical protein
MIFYWSHIVYLNFLEHILTVSMLKDLPIFAPFIYHEFISTLLGIGDDIDI